MSTQSWSTRVRHDSDETFREWGAEFSSFLAAAGLTQTSDTGQIDWLSVTRSSVNTNAGYEVWRFNDDLQATAPIFIRFDYGTSQTATAPRILVTVGTGSNGSGTITGTALTSALSAVGGSTGQTADTLRNSYMNYSAARGFFGFNWKVGSGAADGLCFIARTIDSNGDPTDTGALVVCAGSNAQTSQALRFASTAKAFTARTTIATMQLTVWPQSPSQSVVDGDMQVALPYTITPRVEPLNQFCGVLDSEFVVGNTFNATLVGTTARTYIALTSARTIMDASGVLKPAMLWE